jgi:hypothetical protein
MNRMQDVITLKAGDKTFTGVATFEYLGTTLTDQNCYHNTIKSRLNSANACYDSVQNLFVCQFAIKKYKT